MIRLLLASFSVCTLFAGRINFDDGWNFGRAPSNGEFSFDGTIVTLPHTVVPLTFHDWDETSWEGLWLYTNTFDRPSSSDYRTFVEFGAVLTAANVTFNGVKVGSHAGGYLPFQFELTKWMKDTDNVLEVLVDGTYLYVPPNHDGGNATATDFFQPAGIYRSVELLIVAQTYISDVFAKPMNVLSQECLVSVQVTIDSAQGTPANVVTVDLYEAWGSQQLVGQVTYPINIRPGLQSSIINMTNLVGISLWSPDSPQLYILNVTLGTSGAIVDQYRPVQIGFRQAQFTKTGFYLNGKRVQIRGLSRHQWFPFVGGAMSPRGQQRDLKLLRQYVNMVRQSHYPQDPSVLQLADEIGMLVWIEAPGWGFLGNASYQELVLRDVQDMIIRDRNHPSVIIYGVRLNEAPDSPLWAQTQALAKQLDDSRQTTGAIVGGLYNTTNFQQDVFSYNDYSHNKQGPFLQKPRDEWPFLVSETIGALSGPYRSYQRIDNVSMQQAQSIAHAMVHSIGRSNERYCGIIAWCGIDYPSHTGATYNETKTIGVIDLFREPKLGAGFYRAQTVCGNTDQVVIEPAFYWLLDESSPFSVQSLEGEAYIWSNADSLELFINNVTIGTVTPSSDARFQSLDCPPFIVNFSKADLHDQASELSIQAFKNQSASAIGLRRFAADTADDKFEIAVDDDTLVSDGKDMTRIALRTIDKYGNTRPALDGSVSFLVSDVNVATLLGDNPFPLGSTAGTAAVWLRSAKRGKVGVTNVTAIHNVHGSSFVVVQFLSAL